MEVSNTKKWSVYSISVFTTAATVNAFLFKSPDPLMLKTNSLGVSSGDKGREEAFY